MRRQVSFTLKVVVFHLATALVGRLSGLAGLGAITGSVADSTGALIPGAPVRLLEAGIQSARPTLTTEAGLFTFPSVVVGQYEEQRHASVQRQLPS